MRLGCSGCRDGFDAAGEAAASQPREHRVSDAKLRGVAEDAAGFGLYERVAAIEHGQRRERGKLKSAALELTAASLQQLAQGAVQRGVGGAMVLPDGVDKA